MPYISLTKTNTPKEKDMASEASNIKDKVKKIFRHPVRNRILEILRDGKPRTQRELGILLSMSNAAVHYHVKLLEEVGIIKLSSTREGPRGIIEKLYTIDVEHWPVVSEEDIEFYIDYTVSWMNERHREGLNILKAGDYSTPFLAGSFSARAPLNELIDLKRRVEEIFNEYYSRYEKIEGDDLIPFAVTFSILPSREENMDDTRNVLEFEPELE